MKKFFAVFVLLFLTLPAALHAQGIEQRDLRFRPDTAQALINGVVAGRQTIDHAFDARRGQTVSIRFQPSNSAAFFNLIAPSGQVLFVGQDQANPGRYTGRLAETGEYAIRVYLVRSAARRGETSRFKLTVALTGGTPLPPPEEPIVEDDGGPDFYMVAGLTPGDRLNMRSTPSAASPAVASFRNGAILRNLGCRSTARQRWCNVEDAERRGRRGWVNGRFLREAAAPDPRDPVDDPAPRPPVPRPDIGNIESIDCSVSGFPRLRSCPVSSQSAGPGRALVRISLPDGDARVFDFADGAVRPRFDVSSFRYGQSGDDWFLTVDGGQERYTVPDAVVNGG
jgi:Bacterial SH3 domain